MMFPLHEVMSFGYLIFEREHQLLGDSFGVHGELKRFVLWLSISTTNDAKKHLHYSREEIGTSL